MGSLSVIQCVRGLMGQALCCFAAVLVCGKGEAVAVAPPLRVTQRYRLASGAAQLSSTGISHHSLLLHIPLICLSIVNSSPHSGIAPQSLNSSSQLLCLPGDLHPCPGYVWLWQGLSDSHSIYAATDQLFHSQP